MFGLAFMEYFYMAYDFINGRIGFAPVFPHPISYRGNSFQI